MNRSAYAESVPWDLLPHGYIVKVRERDRWVHALAWAVNTETRELQVTIGKRLLRRGDRPTRNELRTVAPRDWLSEEQDIPGLGARPG